MKTTKYLCKFKLNGTTYETVSSRGIFDFDKGFWVDEDFELTLGSKCKWWIPPHKVEYVEKIVE